MTPRDQLSRAITATEQAKEGGKVMLPTETAKALLEQLDRTPSPSHEPA